LKYNSKDEVNDRKFSSTSLIEFLSSTIDALPPSSTDLIDLFTQYLEEIQLLAQEAKTSQQPLANERQTKKLALTSEFEIESRPGMRSTRVSAKLRQERDRENMTSEDEEYTKLIESINEFLKDLFG
jgi:Skp family chaperone for outer membrane proteins